MRKSAVYTFFLTLTGGWEDMLSRMAGHRETRKRWQKSSKRSHSSHAA